MSQEDSLKKFSHDIKNTLTTILVHAQLLKRKITRHEDHALTPHLEKIEEGVSRALRQLQEFREGNGRNG